MLKIGQLNLLKVKQILDFIVFLEADDEQIVSLPKQQLPPEMKIGDDIEVFVYFDNNEELIATTKMPKAMVGDFALLTVVGICGVGAFADIGLEKDLLIPFSEHRKRIEEGDNLFVYIYLDKASGRLVGSSKLNKFLDKTPADYKRGQEVELIAAENSDLGMKMVVNKSHWGLLFKSDMFGKIFVGKKLKGYIREVREDGKINISLQPLGQKKVDDLSTKIMDALERCDGFLPLSDKSTPDAIFKEFRTSKATYKRTIGSLYKAGKITIAREGISLVKTDN